MKKVNAEGKGWFIVICAPLRHCRSDSAVVCVCVAMVKHSAQGQYMLLECH